MTSPESITMLIEKKEVELAALRVDMKEIGSGFFYETLNHRAKLLELEIERLRAIRTQIAAQPTEAEVQ